HAGVEIDDALRADDLLTIAEIEFDVLGVELTEPGEVGGIEGGNVRAEIVLGHVRQPWRKITKITPSPGLAENEGRPRAFRLVTGISKNNQIGKMFCGIMLQTFLWAGESGRE